MSIALHKPLSADDGMATLLNRLDSQLPLLKDLARQDDMQAIFPVQAIDALQRMGLLRAVLAPTSGGFGLGWSPASTRSLLEILTRLGAAHLAVARLYEGHVNAYLLLHSYGNLAQRARLDAYVAGGGLLGVWNAPSPQGPLRLLDHDGKRVLEGSKIYASGVGFVRRPLVTATDEDGRLLMVWPDATGARTDLTDWKVLGMRASATGTIVFDRHAVAADDIVGGDNDYHRQPMFSGGAWRFLAAQLGAAGALLDLARQELLASGRDGDPHQRARLAEAAIQIETGRLWVDSAARIAERTGLSLAVEDTVDYVGMARLAVERAALEVVALVQRSIGLRSMLEVSPLERICRDLATYLRQPAPDAVRDRVADAVLRNATPFLQRWPW